MGLISTMKNKDKSPYNTAFVEKIKRSEEDFKAGKFKAIKTDDLWNKNTLKNLVNK